MTGAKKIPHKFYQKLTSSGKGHSSVATGVLTKLCFLINNSWLSLAPGLTAQQLREISSLLGVPVGDGRGGPGWADTRLV